VLITSSYFIDKQMNQSIKIYFHI